MTSLGSRLAVAALAISAFVLSSRALAQRRGPARAARSPFAAALVEHARLDAGAAAVVEERVRTAVHRALRSTRSTVTSVVLRSLMNDGLSYVEASTRVEELAGRDASSADIMGALVRYFARADLLSCATASVGLGLRVQECEVARAAVTAQPVDGPWEPGDGGEWAAELEARGMRGRVSRNVAALVSQRMAIILRRRGAGVGAQALFRACPAERVDGLERLRRWDRGATPEMVHCIARWLGTARSRDGAAVALSQALGVSTGDALRLHDLLVAYDRGEAVSWAE